MNISIMLILSAIFSSHALAQTVNSAPLEEETFMPIISIYETKINGKASVEIIDKNELFEHIGRPDQKRAITDENINECDVNAMADEDDDPAFYYDYDKTTFMEMKSGKIYLISLDFSTGRFYLQTPNKHVLNKETDREQLFKYYPSLKAEGEDDVIFAAPCPECDAVLIRIHFNKDLQLDGIRMLGQC